MYSKEKNFKGRIIMEEILKEYFGIDNLSYRRFLPVNGKNR